ncbi:hypothetical protein [Roseimaritima ulvae]|uniref:DUF5658 domain-containing protein n=1 Tax=Roseimaritima ulvae TaxID=980254 RepID=A0A5B9QRL7_9BACT|nr:hypothetical protein [Roseimaritima ulvae]QEG40330.1 hypothetical protein UC8_23390 [Roseimaritima ulvae]
MSTAPFEIIEMEPSGSLATAGSRQWLQFLHQHAAVVIAVSMLGIGLISAFDFFVTIKTAHCLPEYEKNVMARKIMGLDEGHLYYDRFAIFLGLKFAGTVTVLAILGFMGMRGDRRAMPVTLGVLAFQLYLLYTLCVPTEL